MYRQVFLFAFALFFIGTTNFAGAQEGEPNAPTFVPEEAAPSESIADIVNEFIPEEAAPSESIADIVNEFIPEEAAPSESIADIVAEFADAEAQHGVAPTQETEGSIPSTSAEPEAVTEEDPLTSNEADATAGGACTVYKGYDIAPGHDFKWVYGTFSECCKICLETDGCKGWAWNYLPPRCYLKDSSELVQLEEENSTVISGVVKSSL